MSATNFPSHWGDPPAIQTCDYVLLPGNYGHGSGTLANWIQSKLDADARTGAGNNGDNDDDDGGGKSVDKGGSGSGSGDSGGNGGSGLSGDSGGSGGRVPAPTTNFATHCGI